MSSGSQMAPQVDSQGGTQLEPTEPTVDSQGGTKLEDDPTEPAEPAEPADPWGFLFQGQVSQAPRLTIALSYMVRVLSL